MLLRGGLVADGIGAATAPGDVLVDGPVIAAISAGDPPAGCEVIDLPPGSVICPGFIDAHAHAEGPLLAAGRVDGALAQGVTTLVVGQDGQSWIGATAATARYLNRYFAPVNGALDPPRGLSVAGYREAVAESPAPLVPSTEGALLGACGAFELEKACYELRYERDNRPDWVAIPLAGIRRFLTP